MRRFRLLSVLITDEKLKRKEDSKIKPSERNARYDGIITFGHNLTIIIENKPHSTEVWQGQLHPSKKNLSEVVSIYSKPVCLEWKEIIRQLNHLLNVPTLSGYEKMMIDDFLSYIDQEFPLLNPFDNFHLCKGNHVLIKRRIENLLKSIVKDENRVQYHQGWGYYIETTYEAIRKIGLIYNDGLSENEWSLELCLYYADTQSQAKAFYTASPKYKRASYKMATYT